MTSLIDNLKKEAQTNEAFNAVCHMFALRKRARNDVTVEALTRRMEKEGFKYTKEQYVDILKTMSKLGIGKLDSTASGKVRALKDVKMTLQSIGKAAVATSDLRTFRKRNRFAAIDIPREHLAETPKEEPAKEATKTELPPVSLCLQVGGKALRIEGFEHLTAAEVSSLFQCFQEKAGKK